jgi:hypothetical protein
MQSVQPSWLMCLWLQATRDPLEISWFWVWFGFGLAYVKPYDL